MASPCIDHGLAGMGLGYATAWVVVQGRRISTTLHRKVHLTHTGEWPEIVRHMCDNPRCIEPTHLIGGTQVDNMKDMYERNRQGDCRNFGSSNGRTALSEADVTYIRTNYTKGSREYGLPALARKFGVGTSQLHRIVTGVSRTQVAEDGKVTDAGMETTANS